MPTTDFEGFSALAEHHDKPGHGDDTLPVVFSVEPLLDQEESDKAGRPIYRDADFIRIFVPGDATNIIHQPVDETHVRRFGPKYRAWKAGQGQAEQGTPLGAWPVVTSAQVKEFAHFGVRTVEHLAALNDAHAQRFPGVQALKQKARDFLEAAKSSAHLTTMRGELEKRDAELAALKEQVAALVKAQQPAAHAGKGK